jgi:hypothetical protein
MLHRVVIDTVSKQVVRLRCRRINIARRSATTSPAAAEWTDVQWSDDVSVAFVSTSRDHKQK